MDDILIILKIEMSAVRKKIIFKFLGKLSNFKKVVFYKFLTVFVKRTKRYDVSLKINK